MTFTELIAQFKPGMIAQRPSWDAQYTLQQKEGDVIRLRDKRCPSFGPQWRQSGYDAAADDYVFVVPVVEELVDLPVCNAVQVTTA